MINKTQIHIIIFGYNKIDKSPFLNKMLQGSKNIGGKNETTFKREVNLENEKTLNCFLYVIDNDNQLRQFAANCAGLILIFDPENKDSLKFVEEVYNYTKKSKNLNNLYITIIGNKFGKTEINREAKDFAERNEINYCDSVPENVEELIKEIYNFNQNKKQEINQTEDASEGNAKKSRDCCGCLK